MNGKKSECRVHCCQSVSGTREKSCELYNGLLAHSGADGYLCTWATVLSGWSNTKDVEMMRTQRGFETTFRVDKPDRINFCFKDSAANWDNNNGLNWSI